MTGYDIDPAKTARLANRCAAAASLADIAQRCAPIVLAVFNTDQVEDVVERELLPAAARQDRAVTSTCDPDRIAALGARVGAGCVFSRRRCRARASRCAGDGVGLIGGDAQIAAEVEPVLDALFP